MLNAAFEGLNWRFRLDGVVQVPAATLVNVTGGRGASTARRSVGDWEGDWDEDGSDGSGSGSGGSSSGDVVVEQCLRRWARLEQVLLPPGTSSGLSGAGSNSSSSGGSGQPDPPAVHVIVCEPEGVNGAALVLGDAAVGQSSSDEGGSEGAPSGGTVLLRRGALWQSRTSLVHQVSVARFGLSCFATVNLRLHSYHPALQFSSAVGPLLWATAPVSQQAHLHGGRRRRGGHAAAVCTQHRVPERCAARGGWDGGSFCTAAYCQA